MMFLPTHTAVMATASPANGYIRIIIMDATTRNGCRNASAANGSILTTTTEILLSFNNFLEKVKFQMKIVIA